MEPRTLRPVPDPLGSYLMPGYADHQKLARMIVGRESVGTGFVSPIKHLARHRELREAGNDRGLDVVLDPATVEMSTEAGLARLGTADIQWLPDTPHTPTEVAGQTGEYLAAAIAETVTQEGYTSVLAPTHFLDDEIDPWLSVDGAQAERLRHALDALDRKDVPIYYRVATTTRVMKDPKSRAALKRVLRSLPVDALWLKVHPFGVTSGALSIKQMLVATRDLHELEKPLVAEHSGAIGLAMMAFGAVGGIESGITFQERADLSALRRMPEGDAFSPAARVYLAAIGAMVTKDQATKFFSHRGVKAGFACLDRSCCPKGWLSTMDDPRGHFVRQRTAEVSRMSLIPPDLRRGRYMEEFLRPATDRMVLAEKALPELSLVRKRLDGWRATLGADLESVPFATVSKAAKGARVVRSA